MRLLRRLLDMIAEPELIAAASAAVAAAELTDFPPETPIASFE